MSTQVAVMANGIIRQMAPPADLYRAPEDLQVARFVGDLNEAPCEVIGAAGGEVQVDGPLGPLLSTCGNTPDLGNAVCGLRPEHLLLRAGEPSSAVNEIGATVRAKIFGGSWHRIDLELAGGIIWRAEGRGEPPPIEEGGRVTVSFEAERLMLFRDKGARP